jgi:hypothetical protein
VGSYVGGVVALVVGAGLAVATVFGIVQSQNSAEDQPVEAQVMDYGTNQ